MLRRLTLLPATIALFAGANVCSSESVEHAGTRYWVHRIDPAKVTLELHLPEKAGEPNTFPKLAAAVEKSGRRLVFAMNSGIFEGNFRPTGLHVSGGREITPLNLDDYTKRSPTEPTPNFFLKPNGVFFLRPDGSPGILESSAYASSGEKPILATQSGPLLVREDVIHPVLQPGSTSRRYRNGVGVSKDGQVVLVCSVLKREVGMSNLYHFAELFRDRLSCPNALYLDGDISYVHIRGLTGPVEETNWFAGILAITEKAE